MLQEYRRLEEKSVDIKRKIQTLPEGKLLLCSNGRNRISWFKSNGSTKEYIKKKDIKKIVLGFIMMKEKTSII